TVPRRRPVLLRGPYDPPAVRKGDRVTCHISGSAVVTGWSDAPFSWPRCRPLAGRGSGHGLFVDDELARAVRCESALAIQYWWGVKSDTVWRWRKAFGVTRTNNPGTYQLLRAAMEEGHQALRERPDTRRRLLPGGRGLARGTGRT